MYKEEYSALTSDDESRKVCGAGEGSPRLTRFAACHPVHPFMVAAPLAVRTA